MGRKKKRSNQQLLTAARTVFLESGFPGSTLEIARRADVAEATLFKRFGTKANLFAAAMAPPADDARAAIAACAKTDDGLEFVTCAMIAMLGHFRGAAPAYLGLASDPNLRRRVRGVRDPNSAERKFFDAISLRLRQLAAGTGVPWDVEAATTMMVAAMHSLALFEMESPGRLKPEDSDALIQRMAKTIWQTSPLGEGVRAKPAHSTNRPDLNDPASP